MKLQSRNFESQESNCGDCTLTACDHSDSGQWSWATNWQTCLAWILQQRFLCDYYLATQIQLTFHINNADCYHETTMSILRMIIPEWRGQHDWQQSIETCLASAHLISTLLQIPNPHSSRSKKYFTWNSEPHHLGAGNLCLSSLYEPARRRSLGTRTWHKDFRQTFIPWKQLEDKLWLI